MAGRKAKRLKKIKNPQEVVIPEGLLSRLKLEESYTSLLLGACVVVIGAVLVVSILRGKNILLGKFKNQEISSAKTEQISQQAILESYTVVEGDDLKSISKKFYATEEYYNQIAQVNNLQNPDVIEVGTVLKLPKLPKKDVAGATTQQVEPGGKITGTSYVVLDGDLLWDVAVRAYGDGFKWEDIAKANNLANPDVLVTGTVLKIPR